jgi:hypothetical protein
LRQKDIGELAATVGERVHDHLPLAPARYETLGAKQSQVMRDEILGALDYPGQITNAQLLGLAEGGEQGQPGRVAKGFRLSGQLLGGIELQAFAPETLGDGEVEAEKFTAIISHILNLTTIEMY